MNRLAMTSLALLLTAAADPPASIDGLPIGGLAPQSLPPRGCAAYLFSIGATRTLAAVVAAEPASLRLSLGGRPVDLPRIDGVPPGAYGLPAMARYGGSGITATVDLSIAERRDLARGAVVPQASLRLEREGQDTVVVPMAGMVGCA